MWDIKWWYDSVYVYVHIHKIDIQGFYLCMTMYLIIVNYMHLLHTWPTCPGVFHTWSTGSQLFHNRLLLVETQHEDVRRTIDMKPGSKHFKVLEPWTHIQSTSQEGSWKGRDGNDHNPVRAFAAKTPLLNFAGSIGLRRCLKTPRPGAWKIGKSERKESVAKGGTCGDLMFLLQNSPAKLEI